MEHINLNGLKKTKQREDVYYVLINATKPLSAIEIYNIIQENNKCNYAISTIYRILATFEEKGLVLKSTLIGDDTSLYEWNKGIHQHYAICLECHKLVPIESCPFEHINVKTKDNFKITGHKIELYGYCENCEKTKFNDTN